MEITLNFLEILKNEFQFTSQINICFIINTSKKGKSGYIAGTVKCVGHGWSERYKNRRQRGWTETQALTKWGGNFRVCGET